MPSLPVVLPALLATLLAAAYGCNESVCCPVAAWEQQTCPISRLGDPQVTRRTLGQKLHVTPPSNSSQDGAGRNEAAVQFNSERWIVRFKEWELAQVHHAHVSSKVTGEGVAWRWVDRHNAAAKHPTDFGLIHILGNRQQVLQAITNVPGVRDIHPDKQFTGKLQWEPEGPLEDVIQAVPSGNDASSSMPGQTHPNHPNQSHDTGAHVNAEAVFAEAAAAAVEAAKQAEEEGILSILQVTKRPGRFTTSFMMEGDEQGSQDKEKPSSSSAPNSDTQPPHGQQQQSMQSAWHTGHDRQLLNIENDSASLKEQQHGSNRHGWSMPSAHTGSVLGNDRGPGTQRHLLANQHHRAVPLKLSADKIWQQGYTGQGVKVGVFDTGIRHDHPHIRYIKERTNWTHQDSLSDGLGHGTFVAGVIGGQDSGCPGLAPDVQLHTFKVFTDDQVSYTSWFLDAFNYAMLSGVHVINLSIGGPDFMDQPFVEKVWEITSSGILLVSAIGNDGPLYGTLNNPADQNDVIGVGGIDDHHRISSFSSRGMTTWELTVGSGRVKPDVMAYSKDVHGSKIQGGCKTLSGTSVASPVVAGAVCLLASTVPEDKRWNILNPASMKQALIEGSDRLPGLNIYEQGAGKINLLRSMEILATYTPRASVVPAQLDLTDHPAMWPYSRQPLYAGALPVVFNATVLNALGVSGTFSSPPQFFAEDEGGKLLHISFEYSQVLWPWSGYVALFIRVREAGRTFSGLASGKVVFTITSPPAFGDTQPRTSQVVLPIKARIEPTPPKERRVVWDQFHSIKYPPGYMPRDNLDIKHDILDWHGDHLFTNFHGLYDALRDRGYYVEVLSSPLTCLNASQYGALLIVDPEDEFYKEEVTKLSSDVYHGLNVVIAAEWYHVDSMMQMKFYDDNTRSWWTPVTGGANIPALNDLLSPFNISLGDSIIHGSTNLPEGGGSLQVSFGADIATMPPGSYIYTDSLTSMSTKSSSGSYAYLGIAPVGPSGAHVAVYADSNCLDSSHQVSNCYDFFMKLLERVIEGRDNGLGTPAHRMEGGWVKQPNKPVVRRSDVNFTDYSFVLQHKHRCYACSHCEVSQHEHCADFLDSSVRTRTYNEAVSSSTGNSHVMVDNQKIGRAGSADKDHAHLPHFPDSAADSPVHLRKPGGATLSGVFLGMVSALCVLGLITVVVIWRGRRPKSKMDRSRRGSYQGLQPVL